MTKRGLILVEGQTEERFVKDVLAPELLPLGLLLEKPKILVTKLVKDGPNFKGGATTFKRFKNDLLPLLQSAGAVVTTLLDYYGLPSDFPGMSNRPNGTPHQRVQHVERAIHEHFGAPANFIPFLALHEYEAWLFASPDALPSVMTAKGKQAEFERIRQAVASPEEIDDGPQSAPSKRILRIFPAYRKPLHGPATAALIGLKRIRAECPHFDEWLSVLERFAAS
jgi:hypothetical protein